MLTTAIHSEKTGSKLTLTISPRKGSYKEMPAQRSYQVKVLASAIPESVTVDGQKQDFVYLNEEFALLVDIPQKDCNREKVVAIVISCFRSQFGWIIWCCQTCS